MRRTIPRGGWFVNSYQLPASSFRLPASGFRLEPVLYNPSMSRTLAGILLLLLLPSLAAAQGGALVVVGGGGTGPDIVAKALALSGGKNAIVAVLPQSSAVDGAGDDAVAMWLEAGAREAAKVAFDDKDAPAALGRATLIWMPGGDQNRFMKAIDGTGLAEIIRARHRAGVTVGGTSAGAAVIAEAMFTGEADLRSLKAGATAIAKGLGLWPEALIDQHFLARQRDNRLISAVMDHPALVGVGIDEGTAVIVQGTSFEVVGKSSVVVIDARGAQVDHTPPGGLVSGRGLKLSVLRAGQTYLLK
jgi:cyanophycinase